MKLSLNLTAVLLSCFALTQASASWASSIIYRPMIATGGAHVCALDIEGVKCWGENTYGQVQVPHLKNPVQVTAGQNHTCALDQDGVKCWGDNRFEQLEVPLLKNPTMISSAYTHTCALDAEGVKCWGKNDFGKINVPLLKNPFLLTASVNSACAFGDDGLKCWGEVYDLTSNLPLINKPLQMAIGQAHICVLDSEGVKCWGSNGLGQLDVPPLIKPTKISAGYYHTCALDAVGVKCWGWAVGRDKIYVPTLKNPQQISASTDHNCALDLEGLQCWDVNESYKLETHDVLYVTLAKLKASLASSRASYVSGLIMFELQQQDESVDYSKESYFLLALVSPAVLSANSAYYLSDMIPAYNNYIAKLGEKLGYVSLSDGLDKTLDNQRNRDIALQSIISSIIVSKDFLSKDEVDNLQPFIRATIKAARDSMNNQKIRNLNQQVDALKAEKQKLQSSVKSAFLIDAIELANNWLRNKAK